MTNLIIITGITNIKKTQRSMVGGSREADMGWRDYKALSFHSSEHSSL